MPLLESWHKERMRVFPVEDRFEGLDTGIGEQDVEAAERSPRVLGRRSKSGEIALVEARLAPMRARSLHQTASLGELYRRRRLDLERRADRPGDVDPHHVSPLAGEGDGRRAPYAARRAGHDRGLAGEPPGPRSRLCPNGLDHGVISFSLMINPAVSAGLAADL